MITFIKKLAVLLLIQVTTCNFAFADDLSTFYKSVLPDFQKLTPEASALGQYGKYGVSGYTGVPNISVPLFTIGSGDFSMPVELCYDASGIKVEQEATYVGLGWNLIMEEVSLISYAAKMILTHNIYLPHHNVLIWICLSWF